MRSKANLKTSVLISLFFVSMACSIAGGSAIYVDDDATAGGNGESWENAYKYLQDALAAATSGDEIFVGEGTYRPDEDSANPSGTGNRQATFQLKNGVSMKGGYAGFGQPDPYARDPNTYETILSGDLLGNDGPNFKNNGENSYHVVKSGFTDAITVLDGFTITSGNAEQDYPSPPNPNHELGGGMYSGFGSPTITNCTFTKNSAKWNGGGMCNTGGSPTLTNCTFSGNSAGQGGGGMHNSGGSPTLTNCIFSGNSTVAWGGGGMHNSGSSPKVTNCMFNDNTARLGGGMHNNQSSPTLKNCIFSGNSVVEYGGGVYNWWSAPTLTNCTLNNNSAEWGGGMENESTSNPSLSGCTFKANSTTMSGGGIRNHNSSPNILDCLFIDNEALAGGAIQNENIDSKPTFIRCRFISNSATGFGGAIRNHTSSPTVLNCLIIANRAQYGAGIHNENSSSNPTLINCTLSSNSATYWGGGIINNDSRPILNNCILWANSDNGGADESAQVHGGWPAVNNCCFQGWTGALGGIGNINDDPLFVQPGYWDVYGAWIDGDYHLRRGSPCINAGDNSAVPPSVVTDLDGNPRIAAGIVDMGAYEDHSVPVTIYVQANASGANNGSSWADAFNDLQNALAKAQSGDEIRVARGAYSPEGPLPDVRQASNPNPADGAIFVSTTADLSWTAGSEATSHDVYFGTTKPPPFIQNQTAATFDPGTMAYSTTYYWRIDELSNGGKTTGTIWSFTTLSAPPPPPPLANSNEQSELDRTATFQLKNGVVIKGGYAGFYEPDPNARDIETYETILSGDLAANDEPNFVNYEENSYHVVTGSDCNESAILDGFTITAGYANGSGKPDNRGGGMYNTNGSPTVINCTFSKNAAGNAGGMANSDYCSPTLINCTFIGNAVTSSGAGMFDWKSASTLINCDFRGNFGRYGAAARIYDSSVTLTNCTFSGNFARQQGGALYVSYSSVELSNCSFSSNVTTLYYGGGIYDHQGSSSLFLTNCILFNNIDSGGMDESAQIHGGTPVVNYCCIQGWTGTWPGLGNTGSDPVFARNPDDGGDGWGVGDTANFGALLSIGSNDDFGDLNLLPASPCINTGDPNYISEPNETDLDGKPRIIGGRIDMGAYEFNHIPVADAGQDQTVEAQVPWGANATLDGSGSSDDDSTPGTIDDITDFNWYLLDPCDPNADVFLGSGEILDCNLSIGEHVILLEVIDRAGAYDSNEVTIIVQDTTPPDINCPPDVILECPADTSSGATGKATAVDTCTDVTIRCRNRIIPGCGNTETIERTWIATDEYGNSSSCVQIITVVDTIPPVITCPVDVTLECPADTSVEANGSATAGDTCGSVAITHSDQWQPGCGKTGILTRTWTATDECGNSSSCMQVITVVDTTPPQFELSVSPMMLWPPDHKLYEITPNWTVSDKCHASPDVSLAGIVANEGDNTIGDGHTTDDIQIGEDGSIYLRSERSGTGNDRVYTITYQAADDCGNTTIRSATVSIPHDFKVLARIASRWLWSGPAGRIPEDLNGDGFVNLSDVARFAGNWTK